MQGGIEDLVHVGGGAPLQGREYGRVSHEPTARDEGTPGMHRREPVLHREGHDSGYLAGHERAVRNKERRDLRGDCCLEGALEIVRASDLDEFIWQAERLRIVIVRPAWKATKTNIKQHAYAGCTGHRLRAAGLAGQTAEKRAMYPYC